jgi:peptidoglycan hydrolase CwlO-like protein
MIEKKRLGLAALFVILLSAGVLGLYVYHNRRGTDPVGAEYQRAADHQQQITEGIQAAEETHGDLGGAIDRGTDRITESQEQSNRLGSQLKDLERTSIRQEESLRIANESLAAYEKETNRIQKRLKAQRNLAYGIGTVLLAALVRK